MPPYMCSPQASPSLKGRSGIRKTNFPILGHSPRNSPTLGQNGASETFPLSNMDNGMTYDHSLNLLVCEHATSSVACFSGGRREVLASNFQGKELNSPNDIAVAADGAIWFTDPNYGRMPVYGVECACQLDFRGVYRVPPGGGELELAVKKSLFTQPNGQCFSPDEKQIYMTPSRRTFASLMSRAPS